MTSNERRCWSYFEWKEGENNRHSKIRAWKNPCKSMGECVFWWSNNIFFIMQLNTQVLEEKGLKLNPAPAPVGSYVNCIRTGNYLHLSGGISINGDVSYFGKLGQDVSIEDGQKAAQAAILNRLAVIEAELGGFEKMKKIVAINGFVNCTPDFTDQAKVLNGASDLLVALFGPEAAHSRSAVGVVSLPLGVAVEINMIVEIEA